MKKWTGAALSMVSLGLVLFLALRESERPSPGPLAPVHADLEGSDGCDRCHDSRADGFAASCGECHGAIAEAIDARRGVHGRLDAALASTCEACHSEHHGTAVPPVSQASFAQAGYESRQSYDHAGLDLDLAGRHLELGCADCHGRADKPVLAKGETRFLGLRNACAECHEDEHEGALGPDCGACHGQVQAFADAPDFRHAADFALADGHDGVACVRCHEPAAETSVAALLAAPGRAARACSACHENSHAAGATAVESLLLPGAGECSDCHTAVSFAGSEFGIEDHAAIGVVLDGAHAAADCRDCHRPGRMPPTGRPLESLNACASCHENPHATGVEGAPAFEAAGCAECHDTETYRPARVTSAEHAIFGSVLEGAHRESACIECHPAPARPAPPSDCAACHETEHRDGFLAGAGALAGLEADRSCARCHRAADARFVRPDARMADGDHAASGFALERPHEAIECEQCHDAAAPFAGRYPGRAAEDCAACHDDPHGDEFAEGAFADAGCLDCHRATEFTPSAFTPERHERARFPLTGAHQAVACIRCHETVAAGDLAPTGFRGTARECETCHENPHGDRFDRAGRPATVSGRAVCERCHGTDSFSALLIPRFDHAAWTGKELVGRHAEIDCRDCHLPPRDPPGRTFGPAASRCEDCHGDPHAGQFARSGKNDCTRCHAESAPGFDLVRLDHDRDTRYPLDGRHASLSCDSCHVPERGTDGRVFVRYRPLGMQCADCHLPKDRDGRGGRSR